MNKIVFKAKLLSYSYHWHLVPVDKKGQQFVAPYYKSKHLSMLKVFEKFKDGDTLKITIEKEKT